MSAEHCVGANNVIVRINYVVDFVSVRVKMVALVFIIAAVGGGGIFFIFVRSAVGVLFVGVAARIFVAATRIVSVKIRLRRESM